MTEYFKTVVPIAYSDEIIPAKEGHCIVIDKNVTTDDLMNIIIWHYEKYSLLTELNLTIRIEQIQ